MKKYLVLIPAALMLAGPTFAGDGGQAVKQTVQILKDLGTNLGQAIKETRTYDPDYKLGPNVSYLNKN